MMGIYIKSITMPNDCRECPMQVYFSSGITWCKSTDMILAENYKPIPFDGRPKWCSLVEVPEPHGDLIDREILEQELRNGIKAGNYEEGYEMYPNINNMDDCVECVKYADAVIKAEGG